MGLDRQYRLCGCVMDTDQLGNVTRTDTCPWCCEIMRIEVEAAYNAALPEERGDAHELRWVGWQQDLFGSTNPAS